jgi:hypothetical protein
MARQISREEEEALMEEWLKTNTPKRLAPDPRLFDNPQEGVVVFDETDMKNKKRVTNYINTLHKLADSV